MVYPLLGREFRADTEPSVADGADFAGSQAGGKNSTKDKHVTVLTTSSAGNPAFKRVTF